ncbi:MAG: 16S rRNA (guanine(966)-N(2))-methyltransferase RsmD [Neomegalonema sp.]|nr:16S rRNA (guanine(966)-N(2))-methyltransferase RsmD [Neomegalonema sp.]
MRIIGGALAGRRLASVGAGAPADRLRPTSDRVRESLFNLLAHGAYPPIEGARVLDLFAGTGALGLEALSRGAERAVFVDDGAAARALLRENVEALELTGRTKIFRRDATRLGPNRGAAFNLVFLDPPYGRGLGERAMEAALAGGWIAEAAVVVWEERADAPEPELEALEQIDSRVYGDTRIALLRRS